MEYLAHLRKSRRQALRQRAEILLASMVYTPVYQIALIFRTDEAYVRKVIHAFNEFGFESLNPKVGPGRPRTFEPATRERIVAIALAPPTTNRDGSTRTDDVERDFLRGLALPQDGPAPCTLAGAIGEMTDLRFHQALSSSCRWATTDLGGRPRRGRSLDQSSDPSVRTSRWVISPGMAAPPQVVQRSRRQSVIRTERLRDRWRTTTP